MEPFSVVRFVSWKAMHDVKAKGFSLDEKIRLARILEEHGNVYITSEERLPEEFERYRLPLPPHQVHHLLAFARLVIGESATMASESAILGTPFVYLDVVGRGYTDEQEKRYGLGYNFRPWQAAEAMEKAEAILSENLKSSSRFLESHARMLSEKIDVTEFLVEKLLETGAR
jgi:predicted glycosyltransferase